MTHQSLKYRIKALETEIARSDSSARLTLLSQLEDVVRTLEVSGGEVPKSARRRLEAHTDELVEAQFDNLPV